VGRGCGCGREGGTKKRKKKRKKKRRKKEKKKKRKKEKKKQSSYLHEAVAAEADAGAHVVGSGQVAVEGGGVELRRGGEGVGTKIWARYFRAATTPPKKYFPLLPPPPASARRSC